MGKNHQKFLTNLKMFLTRSEYDRSVNTFSPEGRLFQVEYAIEAIKLGSTAIGIRTDEGCVLTSEKIVEVDTHLATAYSGLAADSKILIEKARIESQNYWFSHDANIRVESAVQAVSNLAIQFGDSDGD